LDVWYFPTILIGGDDIPLMLAVQSVLFSFQWKWPFLCWVLLKELGFLPSVVRGLPFLALEGFLLQSRLDPFFEIEMLDFPLL